MQSPSDRGALLVQFRNVDFFTELGFKASPLLSLLLPEGPSPPHSPDLEAAASRGVRDSKENKEPSPKMRRRRSVKISSITLEATQWQNDALHILTSTHDYRSMNDFLMKKVGEKNAVKQELQKVLGFCF